MAPFEIMVSESQERMLCVCEPAKVADVLAICERWEIHGTAIGTVTEGNRFRVLDGDAVVGDMPVSGLVDDAPLYDLAPAKPTGTLYAAPAATLPLDADVHQALLALVGSPNLASRRPLFQQYDCLVQSRTVTRPEQADAAVLWLHDMGEGAPAIATSIDGNGRRVAADPYWGTVGNVLECAANLAAVGAKPLGTTNNLNFGNPEKPHIAWQLTEAVRGLGDACRALEAPIVGGNVSLYNENADGPIYPTPVVGMVGVLPDPARAGRLAFASAGDAIAVVGWEDGAAAGSLAASELAKLRGEALPDGLPAIDIPAVVATLAAVREAVRAGELTSVHDIAEGGLLMAVVESALAGGVGAALDLGDVDDVWAALFGERAGGFVVSAPREALERLGERVAVRPIGSVGGESVTVSIADLSETWTLAELTEASRALEPLFP
jgi:phosphoribosylformylglycinamidine synthase